MGSPGTFSAFPGHVTSVFVMPLTKIQELGPSQAMTPVLNVDILGIQTWMLINHTAHLWLFLGSGQQARGLHCHSQSC